MRRRKYDATSLATSAETLTTLNGVLAGLTFTASISFSQIELPYPWVTYF